MNFVQIIVGGVELMLILLAVAMIVGAIIYGLGYLIYWLIQPLIYMIWKWNQHKAERNTKLSTEAIRLLKIAKEGERQREERHKKFVAEVSDYKQNIAPQIYQSHIRPRLDAAALNGARSIKIKISDQDETTEIPLKNVSRRVVFQALMEYVRELGIAAYLDNELGFRDFNTDVLKIEIPKSTSK